MKIVALAVCLAALSGLPTVAEAMPVYAGKVLQETGSGGLVQRAKSSPMSDRELYRLLRDEGYSDISSIRRRGTTYTVQARDYRGRYVQVTVDGRSQRIIDVVRLRDPGYNYYREDNYRWDDPPRYGYERPYQRPRPLPWDNGYSTGNRSGGSIQMDSRGVPYDPNNPCFPAFCKNR